MLLKTLKYIYHYNIGSAALPYPPLLLWVEPTNRCNLRCTMCPNSIAGKHREQGNMDPALFEKIVREASGWVDIFYIFLAGESLLHKQLPGMVRTASDAGVRVTLHTNGCLMTRERAAALVDSGLHEISFSFDAMDPAEYEQRRAGANYEKTLENIKGFLEVKKEKNARKPKVDIQCIDFEGSADRAARAKFAAMFKGLPVDRINVIPAHTWAGTFKDDDSLKAVRKSEEYFPCKFPWCSMAIAWNGDVVACCNDLFGEALLGNVAEQTMREVWNSHAMQRFRQAMVAARFTEYPVCSDCDVPYNHNNARAPVRWARSLTNRNVAGITATGIELARRSLAKIKETAKR